MLLDQIDALNRQIDQLTTRVEAVIAAIPTAGIPTADDADHPGPDQAAFHAEPTAIERLDEIPGVSRLGAQIILAEVGLDMARFPTANHLASWAKLTPRTIQPGSKHRAGKTGKGNPYLKGLLGEAALAASKTNTFLGERYRRLGKRRGKLKALVAVARSILIIVWHLLADPTTRFHELGADYHTTRINRGRKIRNLVQQLEALGQTVTLQPAA
ncbi:MAG: transposase [Dactylosporangium sp.]|nr:transposase [Dactylosporangium sp.]